MKKFIIYFTAFLFYAQITCAQNVGELAPDFSLKNLNDENYTLSENRGKVIFVFLIGYNCPLCFASAPTVNTKIVNYFTGYYDIFQPLLIDTWDGSTAGVQDFKNSTGIDAIYLQKGGSVAVDWSSTFDRIVVVDADGTMIFKGTSPASADADSAQSVIQNALDNVITAVDQKKENEEFSLGQNYPNPFNNKSRVEFTVFKPADVTLSIFDITGKKIGEPVHKHYPKGKYSVELNADKFKKGVYIYRMQAGNFLSVKRMIVN